MRRHQRKGYSKSDIVGRANEARLADLERRGRDDRGWPIPGSVERGFGELHGAAWHRFYRLWVLRDYLSPYERADHLRRARLCLEYAKRCDRPSLPA